MLLKVFNIKFIYINIYLNKYNLLTKKLIFIYFYIFPDIILKS